MAWFRIDREPPGEWSWEPFASPRYRFDSESGALRVRYAGDSERVAMRERFDDLGRRIPPADLDSHLIALHGRIQVLDLRRDRILDALKLDDQINTSRAPGPWAAGQRLVDLVHDWFGARCHGLVYRSRTTPQRSANLAFFAGAPLTADDRGPLRRHEALLASCVLSDGFEIKTWR